LLNSLGVSLVSNFRFLTIHAIDAMTGTRKWLLAMDKSVFSSPVVSNGVIYVGTGLGCYRNEGGYLYAVGVPSNQVNTQTTVSAQTITTDPAADTTEFTQIWDRNNLIYVILLVFVLIFGALVYDTYYKKKK